MQEVNIHTRKSARYFTLGKPNSTKLLYVLHGYGQLANEFLSKFDSLENDYFIVAPEGLHRFYRKGFYGRVGASWMTKEDRLADIKDYIHFLNEVHDNIITAQHYEKITVLGFSQGVATAFRWIEAASFNIHHCIICSGMIPPDIKINLNNKDFTNIKWTYISGDDDEFRDDEEVESFIKAFKQSKLDLKSYEFEGGHKIDISSIKVALESQ